MSDQPYPPGNPWHLEGTRSLEYDPDKAKALLKEARAVGTQIKLVVQREHHDCSRDGAGGPGSLDYCRVKSDCRCSRYGAVSRGPEARATLTR